MERIRTYIEGLDERMDGGIPKANMVLLVGGPGTMKSTMAYSILYNNYLNDGVRGLYIMLEQSRNSFIDHLEYMGYDPDETGQSLTILDLALLRKNLDMKRSAWLDIFKMYCKNLRDTSDFQLLVVDSLNILEVLAEFNEPRKDLFDFFGFLKGLNVTTILVAEMGEHSASLARKGEDFLSDGIVHLRQVRLDDINIQRRLRVVKMRGTEHELGLLTLLHQDGYFRVTRVVGD